MLPPSKSHLSKSKVGLERISVEFVGSYKAIRLAALKNDPLSFGGTYEREALLTDVEWMRRAKSLDGQDRVGFLAFRDGVPYGLVACFRDTEDPMVGEVISMWVSPSERRKGLGTELLQAVRDWAAQRGIVSLRLLVTSANAAGIDFYKRNGFKLTGKSKPYPHHAEMLEVEMSNRIFPALRGE